MTSHALNRQPGQRALDDPAQTRNEGQPGPPTQRLRLAGFIPGAFRGST